MSVVKRGFLTRTLAVAGAATLAVVGLAAGAHADVGPDQPHAPNVGSLNVHKYLGSHAEAGDGTIMDPAPDLPPGVGVGFTLQQVGMTSGSSCEAIDLTTVKGWEDAEGTYFKGEPSGDYCLIPGTEVTETTDQAGNAVFAGLPLGLYYVWESHTPQPQPGEPGIIDPVKPFYVTIPYQSENEVDGWVYDVHVYPKNAVAGGPTKVIDERPEGLTVGSTVTWRITEEIPVFDDDETLNSASIWDTLDKRLEYANSTVTLTCSGVDQVIFSDKDGVTANPVLMTLDKGTDGLSLEWSFNSAGLQKLRSSECVGGSFEIALTTKVLEVGDSGVIVNNNYGAKYNGVPIPGGPNPTTFWGQLEILKTDNVKTPLKGAEFKVYEKQDGVPCPAESPVGDAVSQGVSDEYGVVKWSPNNPDNSSPLGLWISNENYYIPGGRTPIKDYCLYETKAPAGYVAGTIKNPISIFPGETKKLEMTVINTASEGPELPLTGAAGKVLLAIGGAGFLVLASGLYMVKRRREA